MSPDKIATEGEKPIIFGKLYCSEWELRFFCVSHPAGSGDFLTGDDEVDGMDRTRRSGDQRVFRADIRH